MSNLKSVDELTDSFHWSGYVVEPRPPIESAIAFIRDNSFFNLKFPCIKNEKNQSNCARPGKIRRNRNGPRFDLL